MISVKNILVAVDFSPCSESALQVSFYLARRFKSELHILNATDIELDASVATNGDPSAHENAGSRKSRRFHITHAFVEDPDPAHAVVNYAVQHEVDLIVIGRHGERGLRRLLLGNVAHEVTRVAECPVVTVPESSSHASLLRPPRRILVPIDFSTHSLRALRLAGEFQRCFRSSLTMLHVVENVDLLPAFYWPGSSSLLRSEAELVGTAIREMRSLYEREIEFVQEEGPVPIDRLRFEVRFGNPAVEIAEFCSEDESDLLVIATHGVSGISRFYLGSVADRILRLVDCPVVLDKPFGRSLLAPQGEVSPAA